MERQITSDAREIFRAKITQARAMSEEERTLAGPRLFAGVCERMKEGLRDSYPEDNELEIHERLLQILGRLRRLEDPARRT